MSRLAHEIALAEERDRCRAVIASWDAAAARAERAAQRSRERVDELSADLREQRDYNRALVQQIVEMRREGFTAAPKREAPLLSSPVDDAILARAGNNARLRSHLLRQRDLMRKDGVEDAEITERLTTFHDPDPDE